jgi:SMI1-KNR4 cell-wall
MLSSNCIWSKASGATVEALENLAASAGVELPSAYFELLAFSNGGEGPLQVSPYNFCLDSAEAATNLKVRKTYENDFPGFFVFGGNGSGEYIALDLRGSKPWPVVAIDMTNVDLSESVQLIAKDFGSFLAFVAVESIDA